MADGNYSSRITTGNTPAFASATTTAFASQSPSFVDRRHHFRSANSPTRINIIGGHTNIAARSQMCSRHHETPSASSSRKKTCMCSPTNHPGSFRCSLHKKTTNRSSSNQLNMRRSAMANSLVRIGTVEGDLVRRSLAALIRPSLHQQKRREGFQPRPSRLSILAKA